MMMADLTQLPVVAWSVLLICASVISVFAGLCIGGDDG